MLLSRLKKRRFFFLQWQTKLGDGSLESIKNVLPIENCGQDSELL